MPTSYFDQFFILDPAAPPAPGTVLNKSFFEIIDQNNNGLIQRNGADSVNGFDITRVWPGDTITVTMNGVTTTITGTTFYLNGHPPVFTPTDGTNLDNAVFQSSTFVTGQGSLPVGNLGPPCFAAGTLILTNKGPVPVQDLRPGDKVKTRDAGHQPILWFGATQVNAQDEHAPIVFQPGAIGNDRSLRVSPQHKMLVCGWQAELAMGVTEVFVAAKHLVNGTTITRAPQRNMSYFHILLPRHHVIQAEGCWSESFYPGEHILAQDPEMDRQIAAVIGDDRLYGPTARPVVHGWDACILTKAA